MDAGGGRGGSVRARGIGGGGRSRPPGGGRGGGVFSRGGGTDRVSFLRSSSARLALSRSFGLVTGLEANSLASAERVGTRVGIRFVMLRVGTRGRPDTTIRAATFCGTFDRCVSLGSSKSSHDSSSGVGTASSASGT